MATTAPNDVSAQRIAFIHALRGVASLLVVWSHLSGFWLLTNGRVSTLQDAWQHWIVVPFHIYQNGGHLGVILFFLISGFIITHVSLRESAAEFAVKRALRIFPPLAVATLVAAALLNVAHWTDTELLGVNGGDAIHWASSVLLLDGFQGTSRALDVTWTLIIELGFYTFTLALLRISRDRPLRATWFMVAAWAVLSVATMNIHFPGINGGLPVYLGVLICGRFVYLAYAGRIEWADALIGVALSVLIFFGFLEAGEHGYLIAPGGWPGVEPLVTYLLAGLVFAACMRWAPASVLQPLRLVSDASYSLYLLHLPIGITVLNLAARASVPNSLATVLAIAASITVAWLSFMYVERPSQVAARRLARRLRAGSEV